MDFNSSFITKLIDLALEEDLSYGDITSDVALPEGHTSEAYLLAREPFVFCGGPIIHEIIERAQKKIIIDKIVSEGTRVVADQELASLAGYTRDILSLERTILNFLQRLSGIATQTASYVAEAGGLQILDTRKTTPGWRVLEKYAVTVGGGKNHRMHLGDQVLIKNNHIDAYCGDIKKLFDGVKSKKPPYIPLEVEVRTHDELSKVLQEITPDIIMLDNMSDVEVEKAFKSIQAHDTKIKVEISGGITRDRLKKLSTIGPLYVSVGALTTQSRAVDISLRIRKL